jgi:hypothetical protein
MGFALKNSVASGAEEELKAGKPINLATGWITASD